MVQLGDGIGDTDPEFIEGDFTVIAYNIFGGTVAYPTATAPLESLEAVGTPDVNTPDERDGKSYIIALNEPPAGVIRVLVHLPKHKIELADPRAQLNDDGTRKVEGKNAEASLTIHYVGTDNGASEVYSMRRAADPLLPVKDATADIIILLSEKPKEFKKGNVHVTNATWGDPVALEPIPHDEDGADNDVATTADNRLSTGRTPLLYPYVLTITPTYKDKDDIVVKVKAFEDLVLPIPFKYTPPTREADYMEGRHKLTIKVGKEVLADKLAGIRLGIPEKIVIPAGGYLVLGKDDGDGDDNHDARTSETQIEYAGDPTKDPSVTTARAPNLQTYNIIKAGLPNLETFLSNGGNDRCCESSRGFDY